MTLEEEKAYVDAQLEASRAALPMQEAPAPSAAPVATPEPAGPQTPAFDGTVIAGGEVPPGDTPAADPVGKGVLAVGEDLTGLPAELPFAAVRGVAEAVKAAAGGVVDIVDHSVKSRDKFLESKGADKGTLIPDSSFVVKGAASGVEWLAKTVLDWTPKPKTVSGGIVQEAAQFITGFAGAGRLVALPGYVGTIAKYGVAGFAFFDKEYSKTANFIEQQFPDLQGPWMDYLAKRDDDTELEGRLKNAIDGMLVGPVADGLFWILKAGKASLQRNPEALETALKNVDASVEALHSLDPSNGVPVERGAPKPDMVEGVPKVSKAAAEGEAPLLKDLPKTSEKPPINLTPEDINGVRKAIDARFLVGGADMVLTKGDINLTNIKGSEDIIATINAISGSIESKMTGMLSGKSPKDGSRVQPLAELQAITEKHIDLFGADAGAALFSLSKTYADVKNLGAVLNAHRIFLFSMADHAAEAAARAAQLGDTLAGRQAAIEAYQAAAVATQTFAMVKGTQTEVARAMNAMKATSWRSDARLKGLPMEELHNSIMSGISPLDKNFLARLAAMKENPKGFRKFIEKTFFEKVGDAFATWYPNALLSSMVTHTAQFAGNASMLVIGPAERALAGVYEGRGMASAGRQMMDEYIGMIHAFGPALREAGATLKGGVSRLDPHSGNMVTPNGAYVDGFSSRAWGATKDFYKADGELIRTETTPVISWLLDGISTVVNMPGRLMTTGDEFFKQTQYRAYLYEQAMREGRARGLNGDELATYTANHIETSFDKTGKFTDKEAMQVAREATFSQDLEYGMSRWIHGMSNEHPITKLVVPFVKTPVNILRYTARHTPILQFAEEGFRADLKAGGPRAAKAYAHLTTGAAVMVPLVYFGVSGFLSGSAPIDPELRKAWEMDGKKEYAVKIGDRWVQYNRLDPIGGIIGLAADYSDAIHSGDKDLGDIAKAMTIATGRFVMSKSYLQGITNMVNALYDAQSGRSGRALEAWAEKTAASVMIPSFLRSTRDDELLRETRGLMDTIKARVQGHSKEVPPVRNFLGEAVEAPKTFGPAWLSPLGWSQEKGDPLNKELARVMIDNDQAVQRVLPTLGGTTIDLRDVKLASGQNAYDRLQQLVQETGVRQRLSDLIASDRYKTAKDGGKDYANSPGSKLFLINKELEAAKERARGRLMSENPDLRALWRAEVQRAGTSGKLGEQPALFQPPTFLESVFGDPKARTPQGMLDKARNK